MNLIRTMRDIENIKIIVIASSRVKARPQANALERCADTGDTVFLNLGDDLAICRMSARKQLEELDTETAAELWSKAVERNPWISSWARE